MLDMILIPVYSKIRIVSRLKKIYHLYYQKRSYLLLYQTYQLTSLLVCHLEFLLLLHLIAILSKILSLFLSKASSDLPSLSPNTLISSLISSLLTSALYLLLSYTLSNSILCVPLHISSRNPSCVSSIVKSDVT